MRYTVVRSGSGWIVGEGSLIKLPNDKDAILYKWFMPGRPTTGQQWQVSELVNDWHPTLAAAIERHERDMLERHRFELESLRAAK